MDKELDNYDLAVKESDVPEIIGSQFTIMQEYKENLDIAKKKALDAQAQALGSKEKKTGVFKNKTAIESLQETTLSLADAQIIAAEAQEKSFEYQKKLAEITKYLFGLGVSNIAANRIVVKELEMRLKNASEDEIDSLAREEIKNLVRELKMQEDVMQKQSLLNERIRELDEKMTLYLSKNEEDSYIKGLENKILDLEEEIHFLKEENVKRKRMDNDKKKKYLFYSFIGFSILLVITFILAIIALCE
ncbi:MAG: hypothetical protein SPJ17_08465 [Anaeroplasma sp.]|uniref:hypothetical protein n=1 Tax=Anaeroplasma sp. TaxID=1872523 RepID=UPI002A912A92|nr:hypothetical protein [Anaeroplasma sp.]MDY5983718.1 hypothetical protein [Anaeroplasma sp.]